MFKSARWRNEKNKIKCVFKLQFHATQLPHGGGDTLMISVVPADVGKPTVRLERAAIQDGSCFWENPVYETIKFFREPRTGKIHEKIYKFVVSSGSLRGGLVGEVSIDFSSYTESTKLSSLSLPLKNSKFDAVLHVSIQRLQENIHQSFSTEAEEIENAKFNPMGISLKTQFSILDTDGSIKSNSTEDGHATSNKTISQITELNGNHRASTGSDLTVSSDSSSGLDTPRDFGLTSNLVLQKTTSDVSPRIHEENQRSQWEWIGGSAPGSSTDGSSGSPRDILSGGKSQEDLEILVEKLKKELSASSRLSEWLELELQTLRKQIVKENKRGQELFREVVGLKEERDVLKTECENLKAFQKRMDEAKVKNKLNFEGGDPRALLEELQQELSYEKDINANLRLQLQKTQESNSELILAVRDLDEMLEQKNKEILNLSERSRTQKNAMDFQETNYKSETDDEEQKALEELVKEHSGDDEVHLRERKIMGLHTELEILRKDKDELEIQMEQLALDYEILKQENHDLSYKLEQSELQEQLKMQYECSSSYATISELETQIEHLENELLKQSNNFSDSLVTIAKLETQVKNMEEEMERQGQDFEADLETLSSAKVEQEQRAIRAEVALRNMRLQNASTADRLQEEFSKLSVQMVSTFEANERLATKALTEASELRLQKNHLQELLNKADEELQSVKKQYEVKLHELSSQITSKVNEIERLQSEVVAKSKHLELGKRHRQETHRVLSEEILMLRAEIEMLRTENNKLSDEVEKRETLKVEMEQMKTSMKENEMKRNEMEKEIASLRSEAENSMEELNVLKSQKDEKESEIRNLRLKFETLESQCDELKHSSLEDESEKEKLRKQVFQLKGDLKKKEEAFSSLEKKLKDNNNRSLVLDGTKTISRNNKSAAAVPRGPKEIANLKDKIKQLECQIKLKETALDASMNSSLEKEKDLHNKIEELERRLEESQQSASFYENEFQKVAKDLEDIKSNSNIPQEMDNKWENSNNEISSAKEREVSALNARYEEMLNELLKEMAQLRERNNSMEGELKEMQERYSEISLKFAEVEGERQQLVMTVRNLKNSKRGLINFA
ncbi:hypothetical protein NMG60_11027125 [Bertholletia excelsa]